MLLSLDSKIFARYNWSNDEYYASITKYIGMDDKGKSKNKLYRLHKMILGIDIKDRKTIVDHINHDTLDNRRENLRLVSPSNNSANRKGANKNSSTGVRNVGYIKSCNKYRVHIMKNGINYGRDFPVDQFEEACNFARLKRKELFGEYAGNS